MPRRLLRSAIVSALVLLPLGGARPPSARAGDEKPTCRHWAVLLPEDAGPLRVYDGVRKGLELAQLERVCLKDVTDDADSFAGFVAWHRTLAAPAPLVFAIGRRAGARLVAAGYAGPGVLVETATTVEGRLLAPLTPPGAHLASARAEVAAEAWGAALRDLLGLAADATPSVRLAWAGTPAEAEVGLDRFVKAAGWTRTGAGGPAAPVRALVHVRLGLGESLLPFEEARALALSLRVPLLSDDPARFGSGAALVVVPDHQRLGRTAAEAGRRLWRDEPGAREPLVVRSTEVWVDLVAAQAVGLEPPLTFLAAADRVRAPPKRPAATTGAAR